MIRLILVACTIATIAHANESFAGEYKSADVQLKLAPTNSGYSGTILYQGVTMPLTARPNGDGLSGAFQVNTESFPFDIRRDGQTLILSTGGESYRLEPTTTKAANPLARKSPPPIGASPAPPPQPAGLTGAWRNPQGAIMRFNPDGTGSGDNEPFRYQTAGNVVTIQGGGTPVSLQFAISGDTLTLRGPAGAVTMTRVSDSPAANARTQQDLPGKYCYVSNVYATGGGARSSNQCITLHPSGQYEYYAESDSYGPNGGATSQSSDRGTYTATTTTITARSVTGKVTTYQLQLKNHPKTNDPMIVLDGEAFVTAYQKAPWR